MVDIFYIVFTGLIRSLISFISLSFFASLTGKFPHFCLLNLMSFGKNFKLYFNLKEAFFTYVFLFHYNLLVLWMKPFLLSFRIHLIPLLELLLFLLAKSSIDSGIPFPYLFAPFFFSFSCWFTHMYVKNIYKSINIQNSNIVATEHQVQSLISTITLWI